MRRRTFIRGGVSLGVLLAAGTAGVGACISRSSTSSDARLAIIKSWAKLLILPGFALFVEAAEALQAAVSRLCDAPSTALLEQAQQGWMQARQQWKRMESLNFGPAFEFPDRFGPKIDFWPVRPDTVDDVLADDAPLSAASLAAYPAPTRGLPVLEYLLFGEDANVDSIVMQSRRQSYLRALGEDLTWLATGLMDAWTPGKGGFVEQLTQPGGTGMYMSVQEALSELVNRMWFTIENIRRDKLGRPLGNETEGMAQPQSVESPFSGRSITDVLDNLWMIEMLFEGGEGGLGLVDHPRVLAAPGLVLSFRAVMGEAREALTALPEPLTEAVEQAATDVQGAIDTLAELQRLIQVDLIAALSLDIAFNDSDGD